jgi:hypothetical protein
MQKPLPSSQDHVDIRVGPLGRANYGRGAEILSKIETLRMRFNPRLVGFGIVSPSMHAPNVNDHLADRTKALSGRNQEDGK